MYGRTHVGVEGSERRRVHLQNFPVPPEMHPDESQLYLVYVPCIMSEMHPCVSLGAKNFMFGKERHKGKLVIGC